MKETYKRRKKNGGDYKNYKKMLLQRIYKTIGFLNFYKRRFFLDVGSVSEIIEENCSDQKSLNGTLQAKKKVKKAKKKANKSEKCK